MCVMKKEERDTGSTKGRLGPRCGERSDSLAIDGMFMLILEATCMIGCDWSRGVEVDVEAAYICIRDGEAGWERNRGLMAKKGPS